MRAMFGRTNNSNIPVTAILFCALFGFLALLGLADKSFNEVRPNRMREKGKILEHLTLCSQYRCCIHFSQVALVVYTQPNVLLFSASGQGT